MLSMESLVGLWHGDVHNVTALITTVGSLGCCSLDDMLVGSDFFRFDMIWQVWEIV